MQLSTRLGWGLLLALSSGCRSQQPAFVFHPTPPVTQQPARPLPKPEPLRLSPALARTSAAAFHQRLMPKLVPVSATAATTAAATPPALLLAPRVARYRSRQRQPVTTRIVQPQQPARHDTLHIVLGALLVLGGIVGGIALGGWLGLGVGAVVVLLGYYFLVLGIGGKHAWLEIFQEFFNM